MKNNTKKYLVKTSGFSKIFNTEKEAIIFANELESEELRFKYEPNVIIEEINFEEELV